MNRALVNAGKVKRDWGGVQFFPNRKDKKIPHSKFYLAHKVCFFFKII